MGRNRRGASAVPPLETELKEGLVDLLWIILIVVLVLALLGFFGRGYW